MAEMPIVGAKKNVAWHKKRAARCDSVPGLMSLLFYCDRLNGLTVLCGFILRIGCRCIYKDQRSCQGHPGKTT
jgi:hypothetical protein